MLTTILAKARTHFGLPPNATTAQLSDAIDAATTSETTDDATDEGAAAGAEAGEAQADTTEAADTATLTRADVQAMINTATSAHAQAVADLNTANEELTEANASLSARLKVVEGQDAAGHTGGKKKAVEVKDPPKPLYEQNPINQRAADRLAGK